MKIVYPYLLLSALTALLIWLVKTLSQGFYCTTIKHSLFIEMLLEYYEFDLGRLKVSVVTYSQKTFDRLNVQSPLAGFEPWTIRLVRVSYKPLRENRDRFIFLSMPVEFSNDL